MFRHLLLICSALLLTACATTGEKITDYTDRSLVYGWLHLDDVDANHVSNVTIRQARPATEYRYRNASIKKLKGGYLYYSWALPVGAHKTHTVSGYSCVLFLCGDTQYRYSFLDTDDEVSSVLIKKPGVYALGAYQLKDVDNGFFEASTFDIVAAPNAPGKREMLELILQDKSVDPVISDRVKRELARLK